MSFTSGLGYLGTNILGSSSAEARATGLRGILTNQTNFGPDGVVECGGYNLVGVGVNANNLTDALFSLFDVVYINYVPTSQFGSQDAHKLHNWLKTKKKNWRRYCTPQTYFGQEICVTPLHCSYGQIGYTVHFPYSNMPEVEYDWEMGKLTIDEENWKEYFQHSEQ